MKITSVVRSLGRLVCLGGLLLAFNAWAQVYPSRPVTIIVPYGPGTGIDVIARTLGQHLAERIGQSVVIENRPGATANIGTTLAAQAKPDGYTLLITSSSGIINQLTSSTKYDIMKDFDPIAITGTMPYVLAVASNFPARTIKEVVEMARSKPGQMNYVSLGGGVPQLLGNVLKESQKINIVPIPYKSTTDAQTDVLTGRVALWFTPMASAIPLYKAGKVRVLGVSGLTRPDVLSDVPTMKESGFPALDGDVTFYIFAPAGTPKSIVDKLNTEISKAQAVQAVKDSLLFQGVIPRGGSSVKETSQVLTDEFAKWSQIIKTSGPTP